MKLKTLLCGLVAGLVALAAEKASAFPLNLTSLTGTITSTAHYGNSPETTTNKVKVVAITLKQVLTIVSNEIYIRTSGTNAPPAGSRLVFDPVRGTYVTNNNGYFYSTSDNENGSFCAARIADIATNFHATGQNGGAESDTILFSFYFFGHGTDGQFYEGDLWGRGRLAYTVSSTTGRGSMTITASGSDYGEYKGSDDGVFTGNVVFTGSSLTPEWEGPFSVAWWND